MFFADVSPEDLARDVARLGLEAVEFALPISLDPLPDAQRRNVIDGSRSVSVPVALHEVAPLCYATEDDALRSAVERRVEEDLALGGECGARVITLHTTCTRTRTKDSLEAIWRHPETQWLARALDQKVTEDFDESRDAMVGLLGRFGPEAEARGLAIAVENNFAEPQFFERRLDSLSDILSVVHAADSPGVGICFDVYKAHSTEESVPDAIRMCGERIVDVHVSDIRHTDTAFFRPRFPLGEGSIDWQAAFAAFCDIGYNGPVILETLSRDEDILKSKRLFDRIRAGL